MAFVVAEPGQQIKERQIMRFVEGKFSGGNLNMFNGAILSCLWYKFAIGSSAEKGKLEAQCRIECPQVLWSNPPSGEDYRATNKKPLSV